MDEVEDFFRGFAFTWLVIGGYLAVVAGIVALIGYVVGWDGLF